MQISTRQAEHANRRLYVLSIVAGVFLPLSFVTGLLGINVGDIPGAESGLGFAVVCGLMLIMEGLEIWLFERLGWL